MIIKTVAERQPPELKEPDHDSLVGFFFTQVLVKEQIGGGWILRGKYLHKNSGFEKIVCAKKYLHFNVRVFNL